MSIRLSYSNVTATVALFIALGGGAYAVTAEKNSVTSKSIKNGAVKSADVKNNGLKGIDIRDDSLTGADIVESTLTGIQGPPGPRGEQGEQGVQGIPGPTAAGVILDGGDPSATYDDLDIGPTATVNAPTAGRILVMLHGDIQVDCSEDTDVEIGVFVDGVPVPATEANVAPNVTERVDESGITAAPVSAGAHVITIGANCPEGNITGQSFGSLSLTGILLGQ